MNANMDAAYTLGTSPATVQRQFSENVYKRFCSMLKAGYFKPY